MRSALLACLLACAALSCGCASAPVAAHEPSPDLKALRVAMLPIVNGQNSTVESLADLAEPFQEHFRTVFTAGTVEEAKNRRSDLIAALAIDREPAASFLFGKATVDVSATLTSPDGDLIDRFEIHISQKGLPPLLTLDEINSTALRRAREAIVNALFGSAKLADYAKARLPIAKRAATEALAAGIVIPTAALPAHHSEIDTPAYKAQGHPSDVALVIGIEKYSDLPEAEFAERDAAAVRGHLLALGYPSRNVLFLTGMLATKAGIEKYVGSWLPRYVKDDSRVFVYFSGHGAPDTKTGQAYLVPWDGDPKFLENTGYPIKRLYAQLNALKAKEIVVVMDSCFSGAGGRSLIPKGTRPLVSKVDTAGEAAGKLVVMTASAADEITGTVEDQGHGLFTYYFLKGLSGAAQDKSGRVSAKGLYDYLLPKVQDAARRDNRDQTPQLLSASLEAAARISLR